MNEFTKPTTPNSENLPVRLIICIDGTGCTSDGSFNAIKGSMGGTKDSIRSIFDMVKPGVVAGSAGRRVFQYALYLEGVGTLGTDAETAGVVSRAGALFNGATGFGYLDLLATAYKVCCRELHGEQDEIFVFGFSRGAFIARALASFLEHVGLIIPGHLKAHGGQGGFRNQFYELVRRYSDRIAHEKLMPDLHHSPHFLPFCRPSPHIRLLGAFDTVVTLIPLPVHNLFYNIPTINFSLSAPHIITHFRHALALNESRPLFSPTLWGPTATSTGTYLEAWFFGHHRDIGGGGDQQGLALWPLQWILGDAIEQGLVVDSNVEPYDVLFSGERKSVDTPNGIRVGMYDMVQHHLDGAFGLHLKKAESPVPLRDRDYAASLVSGGAHQVFLHPSVYLLWDVSAEFRRQSWGWKYLRSFMKDRAGMLPREAPWWEGIAQEGILRELEGVEKLNMLICGREGLGKAALVGRIFGECVFRRGGGWATASLNPLPVTGNNQVQIYLSDSSGTTSDNATLLRGHLAQQEENTPLADQIHIIWYFLDVTSPTTDSDRRLLSIDFKEIPVVVVLKNEIELRDSIYKDFADGKLREGITVQGMFLEVVERRKRELGGLKVRAWVQDRDTRETPNLLLTAIFPLLRKEALQITLTKSQRLLLPPKIALATAETMRAYTIWHASTFTHIQLLFHPAPARHRLCRLLIDSILSAFNLRSNGDEALIVAKLGRPWCALDLFPRGLWDERVPGEMVLMCMVDTIVVMVYAFSHQKVEGRAKTGMDVAVPLEMEEMERACAWYVGSRQEEVHARVKGWLRREDGAPVGGSVAGLQMEVMEVVEGEREKAVKAGTSAIGGVLRGLWGGRGLFG